LVKITKNMAYGMMAAAAVLWGTSGTLTKIAIDDKGATANEVAVFAALSGTIVLMVILAVFDKKAFRVSARDLPALLVFATITGALFSLAWYNAIDLTSVATAVVLLYTYPSMVTIASVFLLGEKMTAIKAIALPLTFIGAILIAGAYDLDNMRLNIWGIGLGLFTAVAAAVYYLWAKKFMVKYSSNTVALYMSILMLPALIIIVNPFALMETSLSTDAWLYILIIGLVPGTIAFVIAMMALGHIQASKASIIAGIEPVAGVILAVIIINEAINGIQIAGIALVIVAVLLIRFAHKDEPETVIESPPSR